MRTVTGTALALAAILVGCKPETPPADVSVDAFLKDAAAKAASAEKAGGVVQGKDGWLFFGPELRSISIGQFWGNPAQKVSRAARPEDADPLPAILDFKTQLDRAGIDLLLVPVPAKAVIYPEKLSTIIPATSDSAPRLDRYDQQFYQLLQKQGVKVLDLVPTFLQHKSDPDGALYCRQDTHWSGRGCVLAAGLIAAEIQKAGWIKNVPKVEFNAEQKTAPITGDLWTELKDPTVVKEVLPLNFVHLAPDGATGSTVSRQGPVLLLGDSHNLVFHAGGDMLAVDAGLPDQLALDLGFPVDLVAVRGSGATPARINLLRRKDNLAGKKIVVWCFSVREFTESQGWKKMYQSFGRRLTAGAGLFDPRRISQ